MNSRTTVDASIALRGLAGVIRRHGTCAPMALEEIADRLDAGQPVTWLHAVGLVQVPAQATKEWAEEYCLRVNRHPDGTQASSCEGMWREISFRDLAIGEINAMLAAAPRYAADKEVATPQYQRPCPIKFEIGQQSPADPTQECDQTAFEGCPGLTPDAVRLARAFSIEFHPGSEDPTEEGDYLLYNQCDGYNLASAWFDGDDFEGFFSFSSHQIPADGYCAWAKLPISHTDLFNLFAIATVAES